MTVVPGVAYFYRYAYGAPQIKTTYVSHPVLVRSLDKYLLVFIIVTFMQRRDRKLIWLAKKMTDTNTFERMSPVDSRTSFKIDTRQMLFDCVNVSSRRWCQTRLILVAIVRVV